LGDEAMDNSDTGGLSLGKIIDVVAQRNELHDDPQAVLLKSTAA